MKVYKLSQKGLETFEALKKHQMWISTPLRDLYYQENNDTPEKLKEFHTKLGHGLSASQMVTALGENEWTRNQILDSMTAEGIFIGEKSFRAIMLDLKSHNFLCICGNREEGEAPPVGEKHENSSPPELQ